MRLWIIVGGKRWQRYETGFHAQNLSPLTPNRKPINVTMPVKIQPPIPILRIARPSNDLDALLPFYVNGLGLSVLDRFFDHDGFDGIMVGWRGAPYHLEFTRKRGHLALRAPSEDNLLVMYYPHASEWSAGVQRMRDAGFTPVPAFNSYWDREGLTFEDPDGYRVVLQQAAWKL